MLQAELRGCPLADQLSIKTEDTLRRHVYCCPSECISAILALTFYFLYRCWAGIFTLRGIDMEPDLNYNKAAYLGHRGLLPLSMFPYS
jgi:hypothetical protein